MALISRLHNPGCLQGLLEMHLEPRQIQIIQVTTGPRTNTETSSA